MPSGFGDLTDQAHHLVSSGDLAGAQRLLADALTEADPRPANATPELAEAASLQARVLVALGEPHSARGWAAFAYAATTRLHGRSDQRTIAAAATLAAVLHRVGSWSRAARLYQEVIIELTALDGPESLRVLAAHADLATVEYARGQCEVARDRLTDAWELHREVYGDGHPSGIKMLARLGAMQRDCGQFADAHDNLALARELCRQHLPAADPLAAQVAGLARAAANPDHVCADATPVDRDTPIVPTARTPPLGDGPGEPYAYHPSQAGYRPAEPPPPHTEHPHTVPSPRQPVDDPSTTGPAHPDPAYDDPSYPGPTYIGAAGTGPARSGVTDADAAERDWWPPEQDPVPPSVVPLAGTEEADGVHRIRHHAAPTPTDTPYTPSRLLPVPVHRAPPSPRNRMLPLVAGGVAVVLLGAAAVVAGVSRFDSDEDPAVPAASGPPAPTGAAPAATTASAAPTTGGPASPGTPPGGLTLRDNRDSVVLRWTYPAGGEGPVVISGGRAGQTTSAFANLPAGTAEFVVYNLDRNTDYCFTVAVVWSAESIARSKEVCTRRR
ncbi:tetratricopeptide repeat protein [Micromonospora endolithica]|uniref:Tetratricopeptide repeat protein n=1 Tax=Micromonospora endolithica TaxID=230091 RepID=A0A3A9YQZ6_9ACTN|nr:tetratricopeptide repeat protein [Micromonospora endolithica]RKN38422.1 tetratricopeptide repeat protein [Micromonospora endolithica]TWJ23163.1 tetratricopeptide repeat protein [Micromonospora endolithica]